MAKVYTYDEETHTHRIGGEVVPGITTCIKPLTSYDAIPPAVLQAACDWGTAVHKTVELFCKGTLDEDQLDPALALVLTGFNRWADEVGILPCDFVVETPMGDPSLMFAGIPDLILDGKLIVEVKTRPVNMLTDSIQTAAQEALWKKNGGQRTKEYEHRVLTLNVDGSYHYQKVNHRQAWPRFRKLLDHYHDKKLIQSWR
jgi:hypothetical protein